MVYVCVSVCVCECVESIRKCMCMRVNVCVCACEAECVHACVKCVCACVYVGGLGDRRGVLYKLGGRVNLECSYAHLLYWT